MAFETDGGKFVSMNLCTLTFCCYANHFHPSFMKYSTEVMSWAAKGYSRIDCESRFPTCVTIWGQIHENNITARRKYNKIIIAQGPTLYACMRSCMKCTHPHALKQAKPTVHVIQMGRCSPPLILAELLTLPTAGHTHLFILALIN